MSFQPTFLYWVIPSVLAGMSMPFVHPERRMKGGGSLSEFSDELPELAKAGIGGVVSLLNIPSDAKLYADAGFEFVCLPIRDGQPPSHQQVAELVAFVDRVRQRQKAVAIHCEAGCGRTGTMLCAYLIAQGESPENAIKRVRAVEPSAIETAAQINFLFQLSSNSRGLLMLKRIQIIDSHTGGEPTRVVINGGPDLGGGSVAERQKFFREQHDRFRSAVVNEPRGSDVLVGALLVEPRDKTCVAGVIFFNNVGVLQMCGHGTIGLVVTLAHLGRIKPGEHRIETCVGVVTATLHENGSVSVANVASYRKAKSVTVDVPGIGKVTGDVAWGGNWFFLIENHGQELTLPNVEKLTDYAWRVRQAINAQGFPEIDHVELLAPSPTDGVHSRNFVLCPGKAYDRSPCGTGTSAKLACLAADGKLAEGEEWVQGSIIGSAFRGTYRREGDKIIPIITGTAFVNSEATLLLNENDPFCWGIR